MTDKVHAYIFTDMELQVLVSMMGKTSLYGFGNDNSIKGDMLRKNTYEAIYGLAKKHYLEYVDKNNIVNKKLSNMEGKFDSLYINENIVKIFRNVINAKEIIDITKWDTMENILIYAADELNKKDSVGNKLTIIRPNLVNKEEVIVCAIKIIEFEQYLHDEGYLPQNALEGLFSGTKAIGTDKEKYITFRMIDVHSLEEKKTINVYEDMSYDLDDNNKKVYSKKNIIAELEKRLV